MQRERARAARRGGGADDDGAGVARHRRRGGRAAGARVRACNGTDGAQALPPVATTTGVTTGSAVQRYIHPTPKQKISYVTNILSILRTIHKIRLAKFYHFGPLCLT